ncbi:MAG: IclR family transcriptional regulator [Bacillota bacterium]
MQDVETRRYRLGLRILQLAEAVSETRELRAAAGPLMDHLSARTRETVVLRIVDGDDTVWLDVRESPEQMRMTARVGRRTPLYSGASNLMLTAYLPAERVEQIVQHCAPANHPARTDFQGFLQRLAGIREAGHAVSTGEVEPGVTAVAAPVRDGSGRVVASLSVSGPAYRITGEQIPTLIHLVSEAAADISRRLRAPT